MFIINSEFSISNCVNSLWDLNNPNNNPSNIPPNGTAISNVISLNGSNENMGQTSGAAQPAYQVNPSGLVSGNNAILFNGAQSLSASIKTYAANSPLYLIALFNLGTFAGSTQRALLSNNFSGSAGFNLSIGGSGHSPSLNIIGKTTYASGLSLTTGTFYLLEVVFDGNETVNFYVNGTLTQITSTSPGSVASSAAAYMGAISGSSNFFLGLVNFMAYSYTIPSTYIRQSIENYLLARI